MPTTRNQKKARKSRGFEMLSDIENLDIMLGENHFNGTERDESLDNTSIRRHESVASNNLEMKVKAHIPIIGILMSGQMPITANVQLI